MRHVKYLGGTENQREANRGKRVDGSELKTVDEELKQQHGTTLSARRYFAIVPPLTSLPAPPSISLIWIGIDTEPFGRNSILPPTRSKLPLALRCFSRFSPVIGWPLFSKACARCTNTITAL